MARGADAAADVAQSMIVTAWNLAIFGGGMLGGLLLESCGTLALEQAAVLLLLIAFAIVWRAKPHGFPPAA